MRLVREERPDLIFMDIMMPGIDGWETARKIKTNPRTKDIPISMLSVKSDPEDKEKSLSYSLADKHLSKPVDFNLVIDTAENLTSKNT